MEQSVYKYILRYSRKEQVLILLVTVLSMPLIYYSLEIPKLIINQAIGGVDIPSSILGIDITQISYLLILCCAYLILTIVNGAIKYHLNVYRGVLSERMLRRLRYELYSRVLRFPIPYFKRISQAEVVPIITAETEPLGGFFSDAFALPAFQGGLLFTYLIFIFNQNIFLGLAATAIYPFQMVIIPRLQKKVNELARRRVLTVRSLASRIGDAFAGTVEIRSLDTSKYERAEITGRLGSLFEIRKEIYQRKYFIKFLNNFLNQITPFFFYLFGGYAVIKGQLSLGALIAVLAAYKDLAGPWKELLKYYQIKEDIRVKYTQIINQFQPNNILDESLIDSDAQNVAPLQGTLQSSGLIFETENGVKQIDGISFEVPVSQHMAIVGSSGCGKEELARMLARLVNPTHGQLSLGGESMAELSVALAGRRISYVGQGAYLFSGSVFDNICYGLKNHPSSVGTSSAEVSPALTEAERTGNSKFDINSTWLDFSIAGVDSEVALEEKIIDLLSAVALESDIYELGLRSKLAQYPNDALDEKFLLARQRFSLELTRGELNHLVELYDYNQYNTNAPVAENLMFGVPRDGSTSNKDLISHPYVMGKLASTGLLDELVEAGRKAAETMVELFSDLPPGHEFFNRFSFISSEDLPHYKLMLGRIDVDGIASISDEERTQLLSLALLLVPAQHRLGIIDDYLQQRLVSVRHQLVEGMPNDLRGLVSSFNVDQISNESTVQDNILFGKLVYGQAKAEERIGELVRSVIEQVGIHRDVMRMGLIYDVGKGGSNLSTDQKQKIALARALIKVTDILVVNDAVGVLDADAQKRIIAEVQRLRSDRGLIWVLSQEALADNFKQILTLDKGKIIKQSKSDD